MLKNISRLTNLPLIAVHDWIFSAVSLCLSFKRRDLNLWPQSCAAVSVAIRQSAPRSLCIDVCFFPCSLSKETRKWKQKFNFLHRGEIFLLTNNHPRTRLCLILGILSIIIHESNFHFMLSVSHVAHTKTYLMSFCMSLFTACYIGQYTRTVDRLIPAIGRLIISFSH
jgi:hypothetical protein